MANWKCLLDLYLGERAARIGSRIYQRNRPFHLQIFHLKELVDNQLIDKNADSQNHFSRTLISTIDQVSD